MDTKIDILFQDTEQIKRAVTDLQAQVMRVWKLTRMDERAVAMEKDENATNLLRLVADNTALVAETLKELRANRVLESDDSFYKWRKGIEHSQAERNIRRDRMLEGCTQVVVDKCPCGNHKGIQFINQKNEVVEELCPASWWLTQTKLAYKDGNLSAFIKSTPRDTYLKQYERK